MEPLPVHSTEHVHRYEQGVSGTDPELVEVELVLQTWLEWHPFSLAHRGGFARGGSVFSGWVFYPWHVESFSSPLSQCTVLLGRFSTCPHRLGYSFCMPSAFILVLHFSFAPFLAHPAVLHPGCFWADGPHRCFVCGNHFHHLPALGAHRANPSDTPNMCDRSVSQLYEGLTRRCIDLPPATLRRRPAALSAPRQL